MELPESLPLAAAEKIILRWDSTTSEDAREKMIFDGDRNEVDLYVQAVDEIQHSMSSTTLSDEQGKASSAIQIAMARLEDEFRNILISHTNPMDPTSPFLHPNAEEDEDQHHRSSSSTPNRHHNNDNVDVDDGDADVDDDNLLRFASGSSI